MSTPIRPDEAELWQLVLRHCTVQPGPHTGVSPRDLLVDEMIDIAPKRAWYLYEKWSDQGLYEWGVTIDLGWVEACCRRCGWFGGGQYCPAKNHSPSCPTVTGACPKCRSVGDCAADCPMRLCDLCAGTGWVIDLESPVVEPDKAVGPVRLSDGGRYFWTKPCPRGCVAA